MPASTSVFIKAWAPFGMFSLLILSDSCFRLIVGYLTAADDGPCRRPGGHDAAGQEGAFQCSFTIGATTTKACGFAYTVKPTDRLAAGVQNPALQVGTKAAQAFSGGQLHVDGNKRPRAGFLQRCRLAGAQLVGPPLAGMQDFADPRVVIQLAALAEVGVEGISSGFQGGRVDVQRAGERVHFLCQSFQAVVHQEVRAFVGHLVDQRFVAQQQFFQEQRELLVAYAGVVLGAGDGKFFQGNAPVQQVPGPGLFLLGYALAQPVGVETGYQGLRPDALTTMVQPQGGFARNGRQTVAGKVRVGVGKACRVVPHFAGVGNFCAQVIFGPVVQLAVGKGVGAIEQGGRLWSVFGPVGPAFGMAAVNAAHGQYHGGCAQPDFLAGGFLDGQGAADAARLLLQGRYPVSVQDGQAMPSVGVVQGIDHAEGQFPGCAPDDVVAGYGVAVTKPAAFYPVDRWHEFQAFVDQPVVHLGAGVFHVIAGPLHGPLVGRVQLSEAYPVLQGPLRGIGNFHAPLQWSFDQRHAAKGPKCQPAKALRGVPVDNGHGFAGPQGFQGGDDASQAASGNHDV